MPKKLWACTMLLSLSIKAREADLYVQKLWDKDYIKFNSDELILVNLEAFGRQPNFQRLFLRRNKKVIWDKTFSQEYGALWNRAYFIPLVPDQFMIDLNDDGYTEFAVATYHGGQAVWSNFAVIFSLKNNQIEYQRTFPINIEFSRSVYESKANYLDETYKCKHCQ